MDTYFKTYSPRHKVEIKDLVSGQVFSWGDVSNDLISISTNKAYGRGAGTWQMMLSYKPIEKGGYKRYHELIKPDMLIMIELDAGDGDGLVPVMFGLVDRVSSVRQGGIQPQRQVKVSGQDMGKLLLKHDIGWDISAQQIKTWVNGDNTAEKMHANISRLFDPQLYTGRATGVVYSLFNFCFANELIAGSKYITYDDSNCSDDWVTWQPFLATLHGTPTWDAMKRVSHYPFNMLTTDTSGIDEFTVYLEDQPIAPNGKLANIEFYEIDDTEIITDDIGISDEDRVTFLFYAPTWYLQAVDAGVDVMMGHPDLIQFSEEAIQDHGYVLHKVEDMFVPRFMVEKDTRTKDDGKDSGALSAFKAETDRLWNWYKNNHTYESGSISIHLRPEMSVGEGLLVKRPDGTQFEYLIEQIGHNYSVAPVPQFTTTLQVTRGQLHEAGSATTTASATPNVPTVPPPPQNMYEWDLGKATPEQCAAWSEEFDALDAIDPKDAATVKRQAEVMELLKGHGCPWKIDVKGNPTT